MGGIGSGRRWHVGSKKTTCDYYSIDVRLLKRQGLLNPGAHRQITWTRRGEVCAAVDIHAEFQKIVLVHLRKNQSDQWKLENYPVRVITTPCNMGGERPWFCCPNVGCGRRVALLYYGVSGIFACRTCHGLAFATQREDEVDRARRKADCIRSRLGWPQGLWNGSHWGKPKGMHWSTYERLCAQHRDLENLVNGAFIDQVVARFPLIGRKLHLGI